MYDASLIKSSLIDLIGWRQNPDPNGTQLTDLLTSTSGLYFNDIHPLLTHDNLESVAPQFTGFDFTQWLKEKTEAGITQAINDWLASKFGTYTARNLLESKRLYVSGGSTQTDTNDGDLVGLEIQAVRKRDIKLKIERIALTFSQAQSITVYLFEASQKTSLYSTNIVYSLANETQWETVDWEVDAAGTYYLVYDQGSISGNSINTVLDFSARWQGATSIPLGKFATVSPFSNSGSLPSSWPAPHNYTLSTNYGLNLEYSVGCDYTDFLIRYKNTFKGLISKRVGMDLLREIAYNPSNRVNRHESNLKINNVLFEIEGDTGGRAGGLRHEYLQEISILQVDQTGINDLCLPCKRRSVRYKTI